MIVSKVNGDVYNINDVTNNVISVTDDTCNDNDVISDVCDKYVTPWGNFECRLKLTIICVRT